MAEMRNAEKPSRVLPGYESLYGRDAGRKPDGEEKDIQARYEPDNEDERIHADGQKSDSSQEEQTEYDQSVPEAEDVPVDEQAAAERLDRMRAVRVQQKADLEKYHAELEADLDAAIKAESERAVKMRGIENTKKNTMDYALKVYGDNADFGAISRSASSAEAKASEEVLGAADRLSRAGKSSSVLVMTAGGTRQMSAGLAEAMSLYTMRKSSGQTALTDRISMENSDEASLYDTAFEFTRDEEEKLAKLQQMIRDDDREQAKFEQEAPKAMTQEEYDRMNRERRFREYGLPDPSAQLDEFDYVEMPDGSYRPLPSLSPEMRQYLIDAQYGRNRQAEDGLEA